MRSLQQQARSLLLDPRNRLYRRFLHYVEYFRPPFSIMENVPGMLKIEGQNVATAIRENFADIGYDCCLIEANALWFGVPQDRKRLLFICSRKDLGISLRPEFFRDFAEGFRLGLVGVPRTQTVGDAFADLPALQQGTAEETCIYPKRAGRPTAYASIMREGVHDILLDHVCRGHNAQDIAAFRHMNEGGLYHQLPGNLKRYRDDIFKDKYKKLVWSKPAWTVTAHFEKDVYTHIHPREDRTVSVREAARLQSFPDSFHFVGHMGERFRQIGNAVPPLMAWGIGEFIRGLVEARNVG